MNVLLTGTTTFLSLYLLKDFGNRGARITAADSLRLSAGKASRFTSRTVRLPFLGRDPGGYLAGLLAELRSRPYDLLLPTFEETILLAEHQAEILPHTQAFLPPFDAAISLHIKPRLYDYCRRWGIRCPETVYTGDTDSLDVEVRRLRYPLIIKPAAGNNSAGNRTCRNPSEVRSGFRDLLAADALPPLVQEKIDGELVCTLMFCHGGRKYGEVIYRNLRSLPEGGGTSVIRESIDHPQIAAITHHLAADTNWTGFLGFDFIIERETNTPYLIDANPRTNPGLSLGYLAGVDWTQIILDLFSGCEPVPVQGRPGLRARSSFMNIAWLLDGFRFGRGFFRRSSDRLRRFLRPEWPIDRRPRPRDLGSTLMMTFHGIRSQVKCWITGRSVSREILADANYDPLTAARFAGRTLNLTDPLSAPFLPSLDPAASSMADYALRKVA